MNECIFVYIFPYLDNINTNIDLTQKGWLEKRSRSLSPKRHDYANYTDFQRKAVYSEEECQVVFRRYEINSAFIAIQFKDANHSYDEMVKLFDAEIPALLIECGLEGMNVVKTYLLKFFDNDENLAIEKKNMKYNCLCSDNSNDNAAYCFDDEIYLFKTNFSLKVSETIKDNIVTLLSLYETAFHFEVLPTNKDLSKIAIKAFWGYKFLLLKCPGSQSFPSLFRDKILIINNLMDHQQMDVVDQQKKLAEKQKDVLDEIHHVEGGILYLTNGILYLTIVIFFDAAQSILSELIGLSHLKSYSDLQNEAVSLIIAFLLSLLVWNRLKLANKDNSDKGSEWSPGYNDRMYDVIRKSQQNINDKGHPLAAILFLLASILLLIYLNH